MRWLGWFLGAWMLGAGGVLAQPGRPPDSLLHRPALQAVVDAQIERDAAAVQRALTDPDPAVRARAAFALASVQSPDARADLLRLLGDSSPHVRADAAFALGQLPGEVPAEPFLDALRDEPDALVQHQLLDALGKKGDAASLEAVATLDVPADLAPARALALGRYGLRDLHADAAIQRLLADLRVGSPEVRLKAAYYFGRVQATEPWADVADSVAARLEALPLSDPAAMHLVLALGRLREPAFDDRLVRRLAHADDWRVRTNAARALTGRVDDAAVQQALLRALDDPSAHVAEAAAGALQQAETVAPAVEARIRSWVEARGTTAAADGPVVGALLAGLAARGDEVFVLEQVAARQAAGYAFYTPVVSALVDVDRQEALERLAASATDADTQVAYEALAALSRRWREDRTNPDLLGLYFDTFRNALERRDLATAYVAAPVLADSLFRPLGSTGVLAKVYQEMRTPEDIEPMTAILSALGASGDLEAEQLVREAILHPHPVIRSTAAAALAELTGTAAEAAGPDASEPSERTVDWDALRRLGPRPRLVLETARGTIVLQLDAEQAPLTVQTIAGLAEEGAYDGVPFHRVVPNFVIQGGDFERGDGFGGPGYSIRSEFTRIPYERGALGMASAGKDTEGSQFFVTHSMQPHLDGRYTAFGTVLRGMGVVDRIRPGDRILEATVEPGA